MGTLINSYEQNVSVPIYILSSPEGLGTHKQSF